jgi:hypothetical protein
MSFFGVGCTVNHIAWHPARQSLVFGVGTAKGNEEMMGRPGGVGRVVRGDAP